MSNLDFTSKKVFFTVFSVFIMGSFLFVGRFLSEPARYSANVLEDFIEEPEPKEKIEHLPTPDSVKAIYMTSWVAGTPSWRANLVNFVKSSELNAIVIDVKDYTGRVAIEVKDPELEKVGSEEVRVPDIKEFIKELHRDNIYTIARISVFQDPYLVKMRPDLVVKTKSGAVWQDRKGLTWLDPAAREVWEYHVRIAREAERVGFDELNFDYIRFPSDGNMRDIAYDHWDEVTPQSEVLGEFFAYLDSELSDLDVPLSADLFGLTTWNYDDLNIGQVLEVVAPHFDYIAPMMYASHYPVGYNGYSNPAKYPYEIIYQGLERASERLIKATSSPSKLRPWLQDFDLGADYDAEMINKQKQAVYDAGLNSWMFWDASNKYTRDAY